MDQRAFVEDAPVVVPASKHRQGTGAQRADARLVHRIAETKLAFDPGKFSGQGRAMRVIPHVPGETGRQLAARLRAEAAPAPAKKPRKIKAVAQ